MKKLGVIALGGNALIKDGQKGTIDDQEQNAYETCENLLKLLNNGYTLDFTLEEAIYDWYNDCNKEELS